MKLSQTAEYALRAIVWLANHPNTAMTTAQVAEGAQIPSGYLSKVLKTLAQHDLLVPRRGRGGGFTLARPPEEISALDVINAVDPLEPIHHCPLGYASHGSELCPLHRCLNEVVALVEQVFRGTAISELLSTSPDCASLCLGDQTPPSEPGSPMS